MAYISCTPSCGSAASSAQFGNVYERDLATGGTRCLTCHVTSDKFMRVHYTAAGDLLLLGRAPGADPDTPVSTAERLLHLEWYWMPHQATSQPQLLDLNTFEGIAVARHSNWIAWTATPFHRGQTGQRSSVWTAELVVAGGVASLARKRKILEWPGADSGVVPPTDYVREDPDSRLAPAAVDFGIEVQDFTEHHGTPVSLVFYAFAPELRAGVDHIYHALEVYELDLRSDRVRRQTYNDDYDEAEGVTPDGKFVVLESDRDTGLLTSGIELYALRLDGTGRHVRRLTFATEQPGAVADQPVVSPDGWQMLHELHSPDGRSVIQLVTFGR